MTSATGRFAAPGEATVLDRFEQATSTAPTSLPYGQEMEAALGVPMADAPTYFGDLGPGTEAGTDGESFVFRAPPDRRTAYHEGGHFAQFASFGAGTDAVGAAGSVAEQGADRMADRAMSGESVAVDGRPSGQLHLSRSSAAQVEPVAANEYIPLGDHADRAPEAPAHLSDFTASIYRAAAVSLALSRDGAKGPALALQKEVHQALDRTLVDLRALYHREEVAGDDPQQRLAQVIAAQKRVEDVKLWTDPRGFEDVGRHPTILGNLTAALARFELDVLVVRQFEGLLDRGAQAVEGGGSFIASVLLGDFERDPSVAAILVRTGLTLIPGVDQVADVQDVIANLWHLNENIKDTGAWFGLLATSVGLVPLAGSAVKGVLKLVHMGAKEVPFSAFGRLGEAFGEIVPFFKNYLDPAVAAAAFRSRVLDPLMGGLRSLRDVASETVASLLAKLERIYVAVPDRFFALIDDLVAKVDDFVGQMADELGLPRPALAGAGDAPIPNASKMDGPDDVGGAGRGGRGSDGDGRGGGGGGGGIPRSLRGLGEPELRRLLQAIQNSGNKLDGAARTKLEDLAKAVREAAEGARPPGPVEDQLVEVLDGLADVNLGKNPILAEAWRLASDVMLRRGSSYLKKVGDVNRVAEEILKVERKLDEITPGTDEWHLLQQTAGELATEYASVSAELYNKTRSAINRHLARLTRAIAEQFPGLAEFSGMKLAANVQVHHLLYKAKVPEHAVTARNLVLALRKASAGDLDELHDLLHLMSSGMRDRFRHLEELVRKVIARELDLS